MFHRPSNETKQQDNSRRIQLQQRAESSAQVPSIFSPAPTRGQQIAHFHSTYGNQAVLRMLSLVPSSIQTKLTVNRPGDQYEQEADRVADQVMRAAEPLKLQRKCTACADEEKLQRKCAECEEEEKKTDLHRRETNSGPRFAPPIVHDVLRSPGRPLDPATRAFMEPRFGYDFGHVRLHTDARAADSARAVSARAYTVGENVVFAGSQYSTHTSEGRRLLAHELAHVVQQRKDLGRMPAINGTVSESQLQRQDDGTGAPAIGGSAPIPANVPPPPPAPRPPIPGAAASICGRPLNYPALRWVFGHAYVQAPPYNYAIVAPLCTPTDGGSDNFITGTAAHKRDDSCDPGASTPDCIECRPKEGVTDVKSCLRNAYLAYNTPTMHKALGPNSNTFAYTLANTCCAGITTSAPFPRDSYPGWGDPPAPARPATCPPGPPDCT